MTGIGQFFFRYRNWIFIFFYGALFIPSWPIFTQEQFGIKYYTWPIVLGLITTCFGQLIRGLTIGLAYIVRGGKEGKPYADGLVTEGMFNHCRNPLYLGNIFMLTGMGILANSLIFILVIVPLFLFIFHSIILAEEEFLKKKFGNEYILYCKKVNRWLPNTKEMGKTFKSMRFNWKRWVLKEHTTQLIWLSGILWVILVKYPELTGNDNHQKIWIGVILNSFLIIFYVFFRFLKKTGRFTTD